MSAPSTAGEPSPAEQPRRRFRIPWGLLAALIAYFGLVTVYVNVQYWQSPGYLAAEHVVEAEKLLGREDGRDARKDALTTAYEHYLEAARLVPEESWLHKKLETLNWRFDAKGWEVPLELRRRADAVAIVSERLAAEKKPIMAVGVRDRGWDPDSLLNGPGRAFAWSLVGAFAIVVIWAQVRFNERRLRTADREAELQKMEKEVEALGEWRKGMKTAGLQEAPEETEEAPAPRRPAPGAKPRRPARSVEGGAVRSERDGAALPRAAPRARPPEATGNVAARPRATRPSPAGSSPSSRPKPPRRPDDE